MVLWQDIRYGIRMLLRKPGFTLVVVSVLAMCIGVNTVIFSVVNAVLLRPLPYPEPEQLIRIKQIWPPGSGRERMFPGMVHARLYEAWREQSQMSSHIAAYGLYEGTLTGGDYPERITGGCVSANFFSVLGVQPAKGRTFDPAEERIDGPPVVVVSHSLWVRRFGGDPDLVAKGIILDDKNYTVVGILPASFKFPEPFEVWLPLREDQGRSVVFVIGRLKSAQTVQQATAELKTILHRLPEFRDRGFHVTVVDLQEQIVGNVRLMLLVLQAVVGFVLLIACANMANLLLARANTRRREVATRVALGAGRGRVLRLLLTENTLLVFAGGGFGFFIACLGLNVLRVAIAPFVPAICLIRLDVSVLGFTLVISLLSSVVGLVPALEATRLDLNKALKPGSPGQTDHLRGPRLRDILVVSEVTLALVLFIGAGLLTKSFLRLRSVNLGFQPGGILTAQISLPRSKYPYGQPRVTFFEQFFERIQALRGVQSVAVGDHLPMTGYARLFGLEIEGRQVSNLSTNGRVSVVMVSPEYFRSLGIPLLQGRFFNSGDVAASLNIAVVNEALVRHYFQNGNPIGQRVKANLSCTIVGVVGDARQSGLDSDVLPQIYLPYAEYPMGSSAKLVIRAVGDPLRLAGPMRDVLKSIDGDVAASDIMTMEQRLAKSIASRRVNMFLTGAFAGLALLLAVAGIYGVMSYLVSQRTHEFGIRIALGAQKRDVLKMVIKQGLILTLTGIVVGSAMALALTRVISSFLYEVSPTDPITFVCVSFFLTGVALLASYIPARKAARIDPMVALRCE